MRRRSVCLNPDCERYGIVCGLLGGCDCGHALSPAEPPLAVQVEDDTDAGFGLVTEVTDVFVREGYEVTP